MQAASGKKYSQPFKGYQTSPASASNGDFEFLDEFIRDRHNSGLKIDARPSRISCKPSISLRMGVGAKGMKIYFLGVVRLSIMRQSG